MIFEAGGDAELKMITITLITGTWSWVWHHVSMIVNDQTMTLKIGEYTAESLT